MSSDELELAEALHYAEEAIANLEAMVFSLMEEKRILEQKLDFVTEGTDYPVPDVQVNDQQDQPSSC